MDELLAIIMPGIQGSVSLNLDDKQVNHCLKSYSITRCPT